MLEKTNYERNRTANQKNSRTLGEKENNNYSGMLEADTIKQVDINEENNKWLHQKN